jgi:hypothetical protein
MFDAADNWTNNSVNSLLIKYSLIISIVISQLTNRSDRWSWYMHRLDSSRRSPWIEN